MTNDEIKQFRGIIREEVTSVVKSELSEVEVRLKEDVASIVKAEVVTALEPINKKLDAIEEQVVSLTEDMTEVKDTLNKHTAILNSHSAALKILTEKGDQNSQDIHKLDKRLTSVEGLQSIVPPPELIIIK